MAGWGLITEMGQTASWKTSQQITKQLIIKVMVEVGSTAQLQLLI